METVTTFIQSTLDISLLDQEQKKYMEKKCVTYIFNASDVDIFTEYF